MRAFVAILKRKAPLDEVFDALLVAHPLPVRDAALAKAILAVSFRRLGTIRAALLAHLSKGMPKDEHLTAILTTGAAQILFLDTPKHSAVDLAVRLAKADPKTAHAAGLVNAVLRKCALADADDVPFLDAPAWLAERWKATYGAERAERIATAHRQSAAIDLSLKDTSPASLARWAEQLGGVVLPTGSLRLTDKVPVTELDGYAQGEWWVQDAAAALPVKLLKPQPGEHIADLCAAPGGKTAQIAAAGAKVVALDRSGERLQRLRENMARLGLPVETVMADVLDFTVPPFDAVLLDAPCSATGTLRRHPEGAWIKSVETIATLAEMQRRCLNRAASLVKPGGRLVYCTCSLEREEGEDQAEAFLARHSDFIRDPVSPEETGLGKAVTTAGDLRTLPYQLAEWPGGGKATPGLDGFFAARFRRR